MLDLGPRGCRWPGSPTAVTREPVARRSIPVGSDDALSLCRLISALECLAERNAR